MVQDYLNGGNWELIDEFIEVRSGKKRRPELEKALAACKKSGATLLVAKLDRLSRKALLIEQILDSKIPFVLVEMPEADPFMIRILAAVAQREGEEISKRTTAALAVAKARGTKLGRGQENKADALAFVQSMAPVIAELKQQGFCILRTLCEELNRRALPTFHGYGQWHIPTVHKLLKQIETL
jgi:DNA invertase Pin-like site-specific DNA recombinase